MKAIKLHDQNHHVHVVTMSDCKDCGSEASLVTTSKAVTAACTSCSQKVTERAKMTVTVFGTQMSAIVKWNAKQTRTEVQK